MMSTSFLYYIFKQLLCISNFYSIARNTFKRQGLFLIFYKNSFAPSTINYFHHYSQVAPTRHFFSNSMLLLFKKEVQLAAHKLPPKLSKYSPQVRANFFSNPPVKPELSNQVRKKLFAHS